MQLDKSERRLVFYSEGKNYWPYLEGLLKQFLSICDIPVCYISSGKDDPGLLYKHPNLKTFRTDEGMFRNYLFEHIDTDVMVMTMPDLHQYQIKRSKHPVHYVYVQHSLVSLHMTYRKGAFDYFDTIFCSGPHHMKEIRAIESTYNLPKKQLVEHGYARLDSIQAEAQKRNQKLKPHGHPKHFLVAPSWGENAAIESGKAEKIIDKLMAQGHQVTLRPHPETIKHAKSKVMRIVNQHKKNARFAYEAHVAGQDSLHDSDFMISDWSGAILDYSFGLEKPVLFIDVPRKVNNPEYLDIGIEPFEVSIRHKIGAFIDEHVGYHPPTHDNVNITLPNLIYKQPDVVGANYLMRILNKSIG